MRMVQCMSHAVIHFELAMIALRPHTVCRSHVAATLSVAPVPLDDRFVQLVELLCHRGLFHTPLQLTQSKGLSNHVMAMLL